MRSEGKNVCLAIRRRLEGLSHVDEWEAYPARLEDEPVDLVTDLGREAAFQQLKNKHTNRRGQKNKNKTKLCKTFQRMITLIGWRGLGRGVNRQTEASL